MTLPSDQDFVKWLAGEVSSRRLAQSQMDDLLEQKKHFDRNRSAIQAKHKSRIVGYVNGEMLVSGDLHDLLRKAEARFPGRMAYFEAVGFQLR
jgi:hypothetical protein